LVFRILRRLDSIKGFDGDFLISRREESEKTLDHPQNLEISLNGVKTENYHLHISCQYTHPFFPPKFTYMVQ
jgi:hypothetical protein